MYAGLAEEQLFIMSTQRYL